MQSEDSQKVIKRFFEAIYALKLKKVIRGKQTFTNRYGINRWNFNTVEKKPNSGMVEIAWLSHLIADYNVSARWLMTGQGEMFVSDEIAKQEK
jgi:hypothetical protein